MIKKILIMLMIFIYSFGSEEINKNNFEETLKKENIIIVDFYTDWCGWCNKLQVFIDKNNYKTYKINVDLNKELAKQYNVKSYPTLIVFKDGNKTHKISGFDESIDLLKKHNIKNLNN